MICSALVGIYDFFQKYLISLMTFGVAYMTFLVYIMDVPQLGASFELPIDILTFLGLWYIRPEIFCYSEF